MRLKGFQARQPHPGNPHVRSGVAVGAHSSELFGAALYLLKAQKSRPRDQIRNGSLPAAKACDRRIRVQSVSFIFLAVKDTWVSGTFFLRGVRGWLLPFCLSMTVHPLITVYTLAVQFPAFRSKADPKAIRTLYVCLSIAIVWFWGCIQHSAADGQPESCHRCKSIFIRVPGAA